VLDDATGAGVIRVHRDQAGDLALFQNQADRWKARPGLTADRRAEVAAYEKLIAEQRELNSEVLAVAELSHGTIETVLAKSDLQLGAEAPLRRPRISGTGRPGAQRWRRRRQARSSSAAAWSE
jgi:hypothetical protein